MTTLLLIRHGHTDAVSRYIAGRRPALPLTEKGRHEAAALAGWLAPLPIHRLIASPLERAQETAAILAGRWNLTVETAGEVIEVDFGDWTGLSFAELIADPQWRLYNSHRGSLTIPGGERVVDVQARMVGFLIRLSEEAPGQTIAIVSHGDAIRSAVTFFLGLPVDFFQRFEISPASISAIRLGPESPPKILCLNAVAATTLTVEGFLPPPT